MLTNADITELTDIRRDLHRHPELSGEERETAARVVRHLASCHPDQIITELGGHGLAAIWQAPNPGPTVMFRAELDALPIVETSGAPHASTIAGKAHLCGHDGHTTILLALARLIHRQPPQTGRVILMFEPAEETGAGGRAVTADPRFASMTPDFAFALHNMPGLPFGHARLTDSVFSCASQGLKITLTGKTAHASQPETGISPAPALATLIPALTALGPGGALTPDFRLVTVTHASLGEPAFGIAPGHAELWVTLRTLTDAPMAALQAEAEALILTTAAQHSLAATCTTHESFAATVNHPAASAHMARALDALQIPHTPENLPMRPSEDFGQFGAPPTQACMILLGAGPHVPALHN
ncbi:MAG: amidohydrolase, partial [Paracoccaceae bacterium]